MGFEIRTDRRQQTTTVPEAGAARSVLAAGAHELGDRGQLVFPNGRTLSGAQLRQLAACPAAEREARLRAWTGYPELVLAEFQLFVDDVAHAARPARGVRQHQVLVPAALVERLGRVDGYRAGDTFQLETRAPDAPLAPPPAPPRPAPPPAAVRQPAPPPAQVLRAEFAQGLRALPEDPFSGLVFRTIRPHLTAETLGAGIGLPGDHWGRMFSDAAMTAMGALPRDEVERTLRAAVAERYRALPASERQELSDHLMTQLDQALRHRAAFRMRDQAVAMIDSAANGFARLAADPRQLSELATTLGHLERSGASAEQREMAARLREGFGLDLEPRPSLDDPAALAARIRERAALLAEEGRALAAVGPARVALEMSRHDVRDAYLRAAGIAPGTYLEGRVQAAQQQGESERRWLGRVQLGTAVFAAVAVGVATGGTGVPAAVGVMTGMGTAAVTGAPALYDAYRAQAEGQAGVAAGTMVSGSADAAGTNFRIQAATYAASVLVPTPLMGKIGHAVHALHTPARHALAEGALHGAVDLLGHALHGHGHGALGISTDQLARLQTAERQLAAMSAARRDAVLGGFARAMDAAGVPREADQRVALLALYLADRGDGLRDLDADRAQTAMERFIRAGR